MSKKSTDSSSREHSAFPLAEGSQLGYQFDQVDAFLERARQTYDQDQPTKNPVTSAEIRRAAFPLKRRGYSARFVDAAMDRLEEVFYERERRTRMAEIGDEAWWAEVGQLLRDVRGRLDRPRGKRFSRRGFFASGYRRSQVDAFLDRVSALFAGEAQLSTAEVRSVVFHSEWRGYNEDQVDALLDAVIELLLATR
ncbi:DivIVA domain-containing protein [Leucobacter sp. UT-8R-CII-1-4]|uniref:DivIVA domain-containing protein n=1 Tax=Leucobacter sp. UT-8R-CII-1-4 TaxID=3040075 RepID=UPI0024A89255|nr:DivIVA domain-containing protein [Leucobacter sp. UT-8R-CII-1-4]MDI6022910.1 DivIVA domain-containing protein [Leucobacter sp. UT-8R-CII-1-4]